MDNNDHEKFDRIAGQIAHLILWGFKFARTQQELAIMSAEYRTLNHYRNDYDFVKRILTKVGIEFVNSFEMDKKPFLEDENRKFVEPNLNVERTEK